MDKYRLPTQRKEEIRLAAIQQGRVSIPELAARFGVSVETVRRDVNELCREGVLAKVYGGAVLVPRDSLRKDDSFRNRFKSNVDSHKRLGAGAAGLIRDGDVVFVDCGISLCELPAALHRLSRVTFIVNSVPTALGLLNRLESGAFDGRVIMLGGELDRENKYTYGNAALETARSFYADKAFISCSAVARGGAFASYSNECEFSKLLISHASESYLVAEKVKFGKMSVCHIAPLEAFRAVITDEQPARDFVTACEEKGVKILLC